MLWGFEHSCWHTLVEESPRKDQAAFSVWVKNPTFQAISLYCRQPKGLIPLHPCGWKRDVKGCHAVCQQPHLDCSPVNWKWYRQRGICPCVELIPRKAGASPFAVLGRVCPLAQACFWGLLSSCFRNAVVFSHRSLFFSFVWPQILEQGGDEIVGSEYWYLGKSQFFRKCSCSWEEQSLWWSLSCIWSPA